MQPLEQWATLLCVKRLRIFPSFFSAGLLACHASIQGVVPRRQPQENKVSMRASRTCATIPIMKISTAGTLLLVTLSLMAFTGCYSTVEMYGGDAGSDTSVPDTTIPDTWPDTPWYDTWSDTPWYDTGWYDTWSDTPWYDTWYDTGWHDTLTEEDVPPVGGLGDGCTGDWECGAVPSPMSYCAMDLLGFLSFPGGYCTASCSSDTECGPEGTCVDVWFDSLCLLDCDFSEDCRLDEGYDCMDLPFFGGGPYCLPTGG